MDQEMKRDFRELRRLVILNYAEIQYLKKRLYKHFELEKDDIVDYANSIEDFMKELDAKGRNLIQFYPHLKDYGPR